VHLELVGSPATHIGLDPGYNVTFLLDTGERDAAHLNTAVAKKIVSPCPADRLPEIETI
jgi:hypothetical protein